MEKPTQDQIEARNLLRELLPEGSKVFLIVTKTSASGMSRRIMALRVAPANESEPAVIRNVSRLIGRALGMRADDEGVTIRGAGMDMGFALIDYLGATLYGKGSSLTREWI